jgi:hypothetical protein
VKSQEKAVELGSKGSKAAFRARLELYKAARPFRIDTR